MLGIIAIGCIIPVSVISCGSSQNNSVNNQVASSINNNSITTSPNNKVSSKNSTKNTNNAKNANSLPTVKPSDNNSSNKANSSSANNIPSTTNATLSTVESQWATQFAKEEDSSNYASWMKNNLENYCANAATYFEELANQYWLLTNQAMPSKINADYLPYNVYCYLYEDISNINKTNSNSTTTTNPAYYGGNQAVSYLEIDSVQLLSFSDTKNGFDFTIGWNYSVIYNQGSNATQSWVSQNNSFANIYQDVVFKPTVLTSIQNILNATNEQVIPVASWYIACAKTNTPWSSSLGNITATKPTNGEYPNLDYENPSTANLINAPICTSLYYWWTINTYSEASGFNQQQFNYGKITKQSSQIEGYFNGNEWTTFTPFGLAGYALNPHNKLITLKAVNNPDLNIISDLKSQSLSTTVIYYYYITYNPKSGYPY